MPLAVHAQQRPVIGFFNSGTPSTQVKNLAGFLKGLKEAGFVEGQNVAIEFRWAHGDYSRLSALAADLVSRNVAVISAVGGDPSALAAKTATAAIPIVFNFGADPVRAGLIASFTSLQAMPPGSTRRSI